jgi:signal transduction histidine kinase
VRQLPLPDIRGLGPLTFIKWERHEGRELLWIGGRYQLRQVDVARWQEAPPPPPGATLVRTVSAGRARPLSAAGQPLRLSAGDSTIRFAFAAPGLGGEPAAQYETRLWGFADGGPELGALTERTFTNLPPGRYVFEARGRTADGRWSQPAQVAFEVLAPWRLTPWGLALQVIAGGLLLAGYIRLRIRRLTRERTRLEAVVAERTAELARRNAELARLHELDEDEKLAARLAEEKAQLELLRYQLNPHFLYNSLNSIRALVFTDATAAGEMVTRLSEFCRATLTRGTDGMTTVAAELELLQAYLDIERTRWQASLRTAIDADPAALDAPLPQFLFLPLVENAIKYGGRTSPDVLEVRVTVRLENDRLECDVANTGTWVKAAAHHQESTRIGLDNLRRRLARHYGPGTEPQIHAAAGWVRVRLSLPLNPPAVAPKPNGPNPS